VSRPAEPTGAVRLLFQRAVVRRALLFACLVGPILIAINHADALAAGDVDGRRALKMGLTLLVPYVVSSVSSVLALRRAGPGG
jgi:hypothetical protein